MAVCLFALCNYVLKGNAVVPRIRAATLAPSPTTPGKQTACAGFRTRCSSKVIANKHEAYKLNPGSTSYKVVLPRRTGSFFICLNFLRCHRQAQFILARQKWDKEFLHISLLTVHRSAQEEALLRLLAGVSGGCARSILFHRYLFIQTGFSIRGFLKNRLS